MIGDNGENAERRTGATMADTARWRTHDELPLTRENFEALCDNRLPCLRIRGFASAAECDALVAAMDAVGLHRTYNVPKLKQPPRYVGIAQFEFRKRTKDDYFAHVEEAWREHDLVIARAGWNPVERMAGLIRALYPERTVTLAREPAYGRYYAGIIRDTSGGGTLHADVTMYSASEYEIGKVTAQISWNLFATATSGQGGLTTIHNRPYRVAPKPGRRVEIEGFDRSYVAGAETHVYAPGKGDVVVFNSHNPHEWTAVATGERRMGIGSYLGRLPDGNFVYWS
jgi:hypothetical protein